MKEFMKGDRVLDNEKKTYGVVEELRDDGVLSVIFDGNHRRRCVLYNKDGRLCTSIPLGSFATTPSLFHSNEIVRFDRIATDVLKATVDDHNTILYCDTKYEAETLKKVINTICLRQGRRTFYTHYDLTYLDGKFVLSNILQQIRTSISITINSTISVESIKVNGAVSRPLGNKFDKIYAEIVNTIVEKGTWSSGDVRTKYADGTPAHYKSYIGYQFRLDNSDNEAHLLTTRACPTKSAIRELYWIWIMQSNNVDELNKLGCKFWDEWKLEDGTIGPAYGNQIRKETFGYPSQLHYVVGELKKNPNSRRIMTEIWVPEDLDKMALTPCVHLTQWSVVDGKLYLEVRQRSCDVALGLVANVYQYAVLHKLVARECGLEPADIIWNIHNVHIYDRHMETLQDQVAGDSFKAPRMEIVERDSIFDFKPDDVIIKEYDSADAIKYEVAI